MSRDKGIPMVHELRVTSSGYDKLKKGTSPANTLIHTTM